MIYYTMKNLQIVLKAQKLPSSRQFLIDAEASGIISKPENFLSYHWKNHESTHEDTQERLAQLENELALATDEKQKGILNSLIGRIRSTNRISPSSEYFRIYSEEDIERIVQQVKDHRAKITNR